MAAVKVKLASSDNQVFEVDEETANLSATIKNLLEDAGGSNEVVPLPNVGSKTLSKVLEYSKYHVEAKAKDAEGRPAKSEDDVKKWDEEWIKVDQRELFDIILAANYLNIEELLELTVQTVAQMIKGKTPEQIRKQFNIKNDFTPEEEAEVNREGQWSFD